MASESRVDVLIIGAGPAGLMCAHGLVKAGINVRIVDQRSKQVLAGQADGIQPRTIEVLQSYGLAERLLKEGNHIHMAAFYNPSPNGGIERTDRAPDVTAPTARYPFKVTLHQGAIETIFLDSMREQGLEVDRPMIPTLLELSTDESELKDANTYPVKVVLKHLERDTTETLRAKFVVGSDGAHSWVRKTLNITMDGEQTEYIWGVVDMIPKTNFPDIRNRCAIHSNNGSCMIIPREGDKVRLYVQLSPKDVHVDPKTGRVDRTKCGPEQVMEVAKKSLKPYDIDKVGKIHWWTIYIIGQRVASQFSIHERVFIAGDACHTHSPKAGQGMNASMNDTHNLVWKLAHVLRGWADISLLKTYEFERRQYAQDLIDFDKTFSALFSGKPRTNDNQNGVSHEEFLKAFQTSGAFSSGIGIHYSPSMIVQNTYQTVVRNQTVGMRILPYVFIRAADARPYQLQDLLPADTRFKILVFAGNTANPSQLDRVNILAENMEQKILKKFGRDVFDVISISSAQKDKVNYTDLPEVLRSHWSKVLLDDVDMFQRTGGGKGYAYYGIDSEQGAIVIVRPDGYVGMVSPLEKIEDVEAYFAGFLTPR